MPTIVQLIKVIFLLNHAKYSPLTTLSLTTTFSLCQKASFVFKKEFFISKLSIYWKEYLPLKLILSNLIFLLSKKAYSELILDLITSILLHFHPNSFE